MALLINANNGLKKSSAIITANPLTLAAWINMNSLSASFIMSIDDGAAAPANSFDIHVTGSAGTVQARSRAGGTNGAAITTATIATGAWHHVAGVFTSTTSRTVFLDGGNSVTNTTSLTPASLVASFWGDASNSPNLSLTGTIAFGAAWNVALSSTEVSSLAAGIHPIKIRPSALISVVDFIGSSPELDRVSGTGWTVVGSPTLAANPPIHLARALPQFMLSVVNTNLGSVTMQVNMGISSSPNLSGSTGMPYTMWGGGHT